MARTPSTMLPLGTVAPPFSLVDAKTGQTVSSQDLTGQALLVMFICNHCPFVQHVRHELAAIGRDYAGSDLDIVAINANDVDSHPEDGPDRMKAEAAKFDYRFPYLFDESQQVARAYRAACTPDFFLFDAERALVYRGQLDSSRPSNDIPVTGADLRAAIDAVLAGKVPSADQKPSIGCNIKWRPGNQPDRQG